MTPRPIDGCTLGDALLFARIIVTRLADCEMTMLRNSVPLRMTFRPDTGEPTTTWGPEVEAIRKRHATARGHFVRALELLAHTEDERSVEMAIHELRAVGDSLPRFGEDLFSMPTDRRID
jgi:hypothetical protein